jgi:NAD-dependent dihydropyrimidine dehydrogenase PreA subunit
MGGLRASRVELERGCSVIELVSRDRCIGCGMCTRVCPTNVFDNGDDQIPVIARQQDCQTCFICEVYCPVDALFVAPTVTPAPPDSHFRDWRWAEAQGLVGQYREAVGWRRGAINLSERDPHLQLIELAAARIAPNPPPSRAEA